MEEFEPLRKRLRKQTGEEANFVPSYAPSSLLQASRTEDAQKLVELRLRNGIEVSGDDCPPPVELFSELQLSQTLESFLIQRYVAPTPVQMQAIPCILSGKDAIILAETGSGKTLAYTLPLCALLTLFPPVQPGEGPKALILVPTRELAKQIYEYVLQFVSKVVPNMPVLGSSQYKTLLVCGGVPVSRDVEAGADVVIATPGKLMQLQEEHRICLDRISYLVVDEVDRFMHGNMEEQLRKIFAIVTSTLRPRQTLLFSATLPENLERLARSAVLDPVQIHVGAIGVTATNIEQHVIFMHSYQKHKKLLEVLRATPAPPVVVFCNTVQTVDEIVNLLRSEQFHVAGLHSEKNQDVRFKTIDCMKKGSVDVLVATDVASRGLDMRDVDHVINYDLPDTIEDYVHRCGRTGRLRSAGKATSFLTLECKIAAQLKDLLQSLDQPIPPELESTQRFGGRIVRTDLGDRVIN
ncbi:hypothetical protein EMCRGX_G019491 [Ephydatia muelleri]